MRSSNIQIPSIAFALVLCLSSAVFGQDNNASSQPQSAGNATQTHTVTDGQKLKIEGLVVKSNTDAITLRESDGAETEVVLSDKTSIKMGRRGWFRADKTTGVSNIVLGLRLKADGKGNGNGQLVAKNIRFDEQDLKTAQALESRVDPVEKLANSTQVLAESNSRRIDQAEQNAQRLSGQVEELSSVANAAGAAAQKAQATADQGQLNANIANERINTLDEYEVFRTFTVHFKSGSARLSPEAQAEMDEAATSVSENLKGWIVAVEGYADSTGRTARNRSLSERRANAVINYLVTKYGLAPRRLVQPFGYGSQDPVAANNTREGRALNRRAEITVLVNKGISSQANAEQKAAQQQ